MVFFISSTIALGFNIFMVYSYEDKRDIVIFLLFVKTKAQVRLFGL